MNDNLKKTDPEIYESVRQETLKQHNRIQLIASENTVSEAVLEAQGSVLTNKYAEGYPGRRYYGGCEFVDIAENLAIERAKRLFGAEHANVQPHSGSQANMAVYFSVLKPGDKILAMSLSHGGHLTHGSHVNFSGIFYQIIPYGVEEGSEVIDYDKLEALALSEKPKMLVAGASAYPRTLDFQRFRSIADKCGALLMVDMAHIAGLVAAGLHPSPVPHAHFVTTTTHKTLRGPRGGMILCKSEFAKSVDKLVFPGIQGGPLMHVIAAKAVAFQEALAPGFKDYQKQILANSRTLAGELVRLGLRLVSKGTDTHLMLADLRPVDCTGKEAVLALDQAGVIVNKNTIPFDPQPPAVASGIRIGTPSVTTRGMKEEEMKKIARIVHTAILRRNDPAGLKACLDETIALCEAFPLYPERLKDCRK